VISVTRLCDGTHKPTYAAHQGHTLRRFSRKSRKDAGGAVGPFSAVVQSRLLVFPLHFDGPRK
jgi:hypothetical protein